MTLFSFIGRYLAPDASSLTTKTTTEAVVVEGVVGSGEEEGGGGGGREVVQRVTRDRGLGVSERGSVGVHLLPFHLALNSGIILQKWPKEREREITIWVGNCTMV